MACMPNDGDGREGKTGERFYRTFAQIFTNSAIRDDLDGVPGMDEMRPA